MKVAKFRVSNAKRNKRYLNMSETYPKKTFAKLFSQDMFPSSVGIGCKGTTKFADMQILSGKSFKGKSCLSDAPIALLFRV